MYEDHDSCPGFGLPALLFLVLFGSLGAGCASGLWSHIDEAGSASIVRDLSSGPQESEPPSGEADEELKRHELSAFLGGTHHGGDFGTTLGGEYEYRIDEQFGVGAFGEWAGGDFDDWSFAGGVTFRPIEPLRIFGGAGWVWESGGAEALGRIGAWYAFPVGPNFLAPSFNLDFIEGGATNVVYGVNFGRAF